MLQLGIDMGSSTVKLVLLEDGKLQKSWLAVHQGELIATLHRGLKEIGLPEEFVAAVTGSNHKALLELCPDFLQVEDIPALVEGVALAVPEAGSIIDVGGQSARFITELDGKAPRFSVNEHCAGGTGSFFEDQMSRLGLQLEDYSSLVAKAKSIPNLSGRCAVFAKSDIIHRQQEGIPKEDILLGLCYAMIRNYKATIIRNLPVNKPIVFTGGVTCNAGVIRALKDIFKLEEGELIIPETARFAAAAGAACGAQKVWKREELLVCLEQRMARSWHQSLLPKLTLAEGTCLKEPAATGVVPEEGCYLGIDVGSTSTDLVLAEADGTLVDFQYLRTAGDPEGVVRKGLKVLWEKYAGLKVRGVGITGSGRERLGRMMGADAIRDEITAQAKAASFWVPEADTVFEIGGQDSKYISLKNGEVADFQMNKICAAGTGSFVEEQAARMGIPIEEFGPLALKGEEPCDLGERCTVFIETAIVQAEGSGVSRADIAAGLCHSIVQNYLHKVVVGKPVGEHIVLQGGVDYNPGIVAAFQSAYGNRVEVSPVFSISGAFGAALLAKEAVENGKTAFLGPDFPKEERRIRATSEEIRRNRAFYRKAGQLAMEDVDNTIVPGKKTIGVPLTLIMFKFYPMVNAFFRNLGYNVVLSEASNEETIRLSQQYAQGETCYPVKLIYGHMMQLAQKNVDYIFLPSIHTIRHPHAHAAHNYACPYMQKAAEIVFENLGLKQQGIQLLNPVFDLDLGAKMMAKSMLGVGAQLGFSKPRCLPGLMKGGMAVQKYMDDVEKLGAEMLADLKPEDKVLVLITRNYGLSDPVLNMGIPEILLSRGYKVMTLGHLPGMSLDISSDYPNMYWPFGDHLLSGAKLIAHHPNLYAVYLTNHGCGPDTLVSHMFKEEMGDKPYLQIEVDEHYSRVGIITRIEAFLNSISHRPPAELPKNFQLRDVKYHPVYMTEKPEKGRTLFIPDVGYATQYLTDYFQRQGFETEKMPAFDRISLMAGRSQTNSKEYLPLPMLVGSAFRALEQRPAAHTQLLVPFGYGADADGQYARAVRTILDSSGYKEAGIVAPILEELAEHASDADLLFRAILTGDVIYAGPAEQREGIAPERIPEWEELMKLAEQTAKFPRNGKRLAAVGSPMCITSLNEGILDTLEKEGYQVSRMPLAEMLWFFWRDNGKADEGILLRWKQQMMKLHQTLGEASSFSEDPEKLFVTANDGLSDFAGNQGRYRYAKALEMGTRADAVIHCAPRYENTAVVLELKGITEQCPAPLFELSLDGDWDESGWARLRSFLYYCRG